MSALRQWNAAVIAAADRLAAAFGLDRSGAAEFQPGLIAGWVIPTTGAEVAGALQPEQGPIPLLMLMAMRKLAPDGVVVSIVNDDGIEIGLDPSKEPHLLRRFGASDEMARRMAEVLGITPRRIDIAEAIPGPDWWF
ncbi:hypothetical protein [Methylococcus capsulatus]|uniref:hypothetical protein n=1 Tax=Methylococcus capsulatus TaxID=414 RepID=UPI001C530173|nr:hypothetical protein [Methylococcus capsulatus]QXP89642.1 hypothetical protein KW114_11095 [Methylococcus capsulatus]